MRRIDSHQKERIMPAHKKFKKISTRLLTVLIICVILQLEQRKGNKKET